MGASPAPKTRGASPALNNNRRAPSAFNTRGASSALNINRRAPSAFNTNRRAPPAFNTNRGASPALNNNRRATSAFIPNRVASPALNNQRRASFAFNLIGEVTSNEDSIAKKRERRKSSGRSYPKKKLKKNGVHGQYRNPYKKKNDDDDFTPEDCAKEIEEDNKSFEKMEENEKKEFRASDYICELENEDEFLVLEKLEEEIETKQKKLRPLDYAFELEKKDELIDFENNDFKENPLSKIEKQNEKILKRYPKLKKFQKKRMELTKIKVMKEKEVTKKSTSIEEFFSNNDVILATKERRLCKSVQIPKIDTPKKIKVDQVLTNKEKITIKDFRVENSCFPFELKPKKRFVGLGNFFLDMNINKIKRMAAYLCGKLQFRVRAKEKLLSMRSDFLNHLSERNFNDEEKNITQKEKLILRIFDAFEINSIFGSIQQILLSESLGVLTIFNWWIELKKDELRQLCYKLAVLPDFEKKFNQISVYNCISKICQKENDISLNLLEKVTGKKLEIIERNLLRESKKEALKKLKEFSESENVLSQKSDLSEYIVSQEEKSEEELLNEEIKEYVNQRIQPEFRVLAKRCVKFLLKEDNYSFNFNRYVSTSGERDKLSKKCYKANGSSVKFNKQVKLDAKEKASVKLETGEKIMFGSISWYVVGINMKFLEGLQVHCLHGLNSVIYPIKRSKREKRNAIMNVSDEFIYYIYQNKVENVTKIVGGIVNCFPDLSSCNWSADNTLSVVDNEGNEKIKEELSIKEFFERVTNFEKKKNFEERKRLVQFLGVREYNKFIGIKPKGGNYCLPSIIQLFRENKRVDRPIGNFKELIRSEKDDCNEIQEILKCFFNTDHVTINKEEPSIKIEWDD